MRGKIIKSSALVFFLIAAGKLLSFLRDVVISAMFGSTSSADAYFAANNIPSIIFASLVSSYIVLLIPTYKGIEDQLGRQRADLFVSKLINVFAVTSICLSVVGFVFIEYFVQLVAPGFGPQSYELAKDLGRILVLSFPLSSITLILATVSNANGRYFAPHVIPVFSALFTVAGVLLFASSWGIIAVAVSGVLAFVFQLIIQISISGRHFKYTWNAGFAEKSIKTMSILALPVFLGYSVDQINLLVNSIISSNLGEGCLSSLNYAQRLQATINGTLSTAVVTVLYPIISSLSSKGDYSELSAIVREGMKGMTLLLVPVIVFLSMNAGSFVRFVYFRGEFDEIALQQTSEVFFFYSFNVLCLSLRELILRVYYANNNTRMPLFASALSMCVNLVLSILFVKFLGLAGLSAANLVATILSLLLLLLKMKDQTEVALGLSSSFSFFKRVFPAIGVFVVLQFLQFRLIEFYSHGLFIGLFILSLLEFYFLLVVFRQKEALVLFDLIRNRIINAKDER